jgi:hypothetical protein
VLLTTPLIRPYERIFSFLDANLQDMAAIQASVTAIDPNGSNSTSIDALQQSFQASVSFNKLNGILDASQTQYYAANVAAQSTLLGQQTTLLSQLQTAQQALTTAQTAGGQNPTADQSTAIATATTNYQNILAQLTTLKSLMALTPPSGLTGTTTSTSGGSGSSLASNTSLQPTQSNTPSFPASKKLDNIQQFYWDRLTRLINTLSLPDNYNNAHMYFVSFNPSVVRTYKKANLLETRYALSCTDTAGKEATGIGNVPVVLDLYPRQAAVNIASEKWRDRSFGLSAALSWFTLGAAASYNQEHLKASQTMAQSSYVSGYGIGGSTFGWLFGKSLGDDSIGVGDKPTEALVAVPEGCVTWTVAPSAVSWIGNNQKTLSQPAISEDQTVAGTLTEKIPSGQPADNPRNEVTQLEYSTALYDSTSGNPALSTLVFDTRHPVDSEAKVSVDGVLLKRARDNFARATNSGGTGGILEATSLSTNTWTPIGPNRILLELDVSPFTTHFPRVDLYSPVSAFNLQNEMLGAPVSIDGRNLICADREKIGCLNLPPLGRPKGASKNLIVTARKTGKEPKDVSLSLSSPDDVPPAAANTASGSAVQVITEKQTQFWSAQTVVTATRTENPNQEVTFRCEAVYGHLECHSSAYDPGQSYSLTAIDGAHAAGAIVGNATIPIVDVQHLPILLWGVTQPLYDAKANDWTFQVTLANVANGDPLQLKNAAGTPVLTSVVQCADPNAYEPCTATFTIQVADYDKLNDTTTLFDTNGTFARKATIVNLQASISPVISSIDVAGKNLYGSNLAFDQMQIGAGAPIALSCLVGDRRQCAIPAIPANAQGFLYFVTAGRKLVPWYQSTPTGLTALKEDALAPPKSAASTVVAGAQPASGTVGGVKPPVGNPSTVLGGATPVGTGPGATGTGGTPAVNQPSPALTPRTAPMAPNAVYAVQ